MQLDAYLPLLWLFVPAIIVSFTVIALSGSENSTTSAKNALAQAKEDLEESPNKVLPKFDQLYAYTLLAIEIDLKRRKKIYNTSLIIFITGILITIYSVATPLFEPHWSTTVAGFVIILAAVGLFFIYSFVSKETSKHYEVLERLTRLGVSIQILDNLSADQDSSTEQKIITKAEVAKLLLQLPHEIVTNKVTDI